MTIVNYSFSSGESYTKRGALIELVRAVKEAMQYGWQPLGAPFYLDREYRSEHDADGRMTSVYEEVYCQAIVRYREPSQ